MSENKTMTDAERLDRVLLTLALLYLWALEAGDNERAVRVVRLAARRLDRESGLRESGKLALWLGAVRRRCAGL